MFDSYFKSFIVGSSVPVFLHFFLSVQRLDSKLMNYTYGEYTIVAPIYLGMMNMLSLYLMRYFKLNTRQRYVLISFISSFIVVTGAFLNRAYNFTQNQWTQYSIRIFLTHFMTFNVIVYLLNNVLCVCN